MKHKYISRESNDLLSYFLEREQVCFTYKEAFKAMGGSTESAVRALVSHMTKRGVLLRLREGIFYIIPYEADPETFIPDWHLIPQYIVKDAQYYIGYYSSLQIHNLITQPSLKEQVVVSRQQRPSIIKIKDISFQFIYHNPEHFFGASKIWVDSFHKVECSDLEKTIIDCLFKPDYAGGIVEIARAIHVAAGRIKFDKLLEYAKRFKSQAVIKRLGFLLELLNIHTDIISSLLDKKTDTYVLLDTELPKSGKMIRRWGIQQNLETETIKSAIYT